MPIDKNAFDDLEPVLLNVVISVEVDVVNLSDCIKDIIERIEKWPIVVDITGAVIK